jgi:hypothetical protein
MCDINDCMHTMSVRSEFDHIEHSTAVSHINELLRIATS